MGELISLDEYRERKLQAEVSALQEKLQEIIEYYDLQVENLPYFDYDLYQMQDSLYLLHVTVPDTYY